MYFMKIIQFIFILTLSLRKREEKMKTYLCFIRHGQTDWNNLSRIQGTINNPLNDCGRKQAQTLGQYLKAHDANWDLIVSSPLIRAVETAKIIKQELGQDLPLIIKDEFIEREFGKAEGQFITKELFSKILNDDIKGIETSPRLQNRIYQATLKLALEYPGKRILIVAHSHVIKGLLTKLDSNFTFNTKMANSALNFFTVENGKIAIEGVNIATHLES